MFAKSCLIKYRLIISHYFSYYYFISEVKMDISLLCASLWFGSWHIGLSLLNLEHIDHKELSSHLSGVLVSSHVLCVLEVYEPCARLYVLSCAPQKARWHLRTSLLQFPTVISLKHCFLMHFSLKILLHLWDSICSPLLLEIIPRSFMLTLDQL